jgi:hypothetical protein
MVQVVLQYLKFQGETEYEKNTDNNYPVAGSNVSNTVFRAYFVSVKKDDEGD